MRQADRAPATGARHFRLTVELAAGAWLACVFLQALLYFRAAPHGGPFAAEWPRYVWLAIYYDLMGVWLVALPFLLLWIALYRRPLAARLWRAVDVAVLGLLGLYLVLAQADHEVMRFLGVRLNFSFLQAYANPEILADRLFVDLLRRDAGGPFLPIALTLLVPAGFLWWGAGRLAPPPPRRTWPVWLALALAVGPAAAPANGWRMASSQFRLRRVEPVTFAIAVDAWHGFGDRAAPADLAALAAEYQADWLARSGDPGWRYPSPAFPYLRVPAARAASDEGSWNILYLQLETFRGADMGLLGRAGTSSPTPWLDRRARAPDAALWSRTSSFGMPSINGLFAAHCSATPPSRRYVTGYTHTNLLCLPALLRAHGYRAEMFNGGDSDWDNSSPWLRAWYDQVHRFPRARQQDRLVFAEAARGIRRLAGAGRPFMATVVSVTNHTPFSLPGGGGDSSARPAERILATTRYMDGAVGAFLDSLAAEPWFARTIVVITGDHGFNVGEHDQRPGSQNLYRESTWVPLVMIGRHPRLPRGHRDEPISLLDLAPTLADLLGIRVANPWQGHSLASVAARQRFAFAFRGATLFEGDGWTALRDAGDGRLRLYRADDWLQRNDIAAAHPGVAERLIARAERRRRLNDYLLANDRVWPRRPS
jgi:phosphoglycerol transferase MdoB-like AlkP superfamily enzyme